MCTRILVAFVIICSCLNLSSQDSLSHHSAMIWRGFDHKWTYNHRVKRIGDYVMSKTAAPGTYTISAHASATGTGKDSTYYTSYYTAISNASAVFQESHLTKIHFEGKFDHLQEKTFILKTTLDPEMWNKSAYMTLLNGFSMQSDRPADKLQVLKIAIEDSIYDPSSHEATFKLNIGMVGNCFSGECVGAIKLDYLFDLYFVIVGMDGGEAAASQNYCMRTYSWGVCQELPDGPLVKKVVSGNVMPDFKYATVGIKSFGITLNRAEHMLEFNNSIDSGTFIGTGHKSKLVEGNFIFKQWRKRMKLTVASPFQSLFAYRQSGYAVLDMNLVMLQFKKADIQYGQHSDNMVWPGHNLQVNNSNSIKEYKIP